MKKSINIEPGIVVTARRWFTSACGKLIEQGDVLFIVDVSGDSIDNAYIGFIHPGHGYVRRWTPKGGYSILFKILE